jgi:hypothetical protein
VLPPSQPGATLRSLKGAAMASSLTIDRVLADRRLLGAALGDITPWSTWMVALKSAFALGLVSDNERETFAQIAGGRAPPEHRVRELWACVGRRGGKSRVAALVAVFFALFVPHRVAKGERPMVLVLAPSLDQAQTIFGYAKAFISESVVLRKEIIGTTASEIRLRNGVAIAVHPVSFRSVRGRTLLAVIFDEIAFWRDDSSATPDHEVYSAVLPSLATTKGMLIGISTPYRKLGLLHQKWRDHFGQDSDDVLVIQGPTALFNPTMPAAEIASQRAADPTAAPAEWDALFRSDLSSYLDDALIEKSVDHGRPVDASGGTGHDAYTIAIGHKEGDRYVIDLVRGTKPGVPFDPHEVTMAYAMLCKEYRIGTVIGDNYAAQWTAGAWSRTGVSYVRGDIPKSQIYLEVLPCFTRELVSLPDHQKLLRELRLLERRVHRSGKDTVDHGKTGHDDYANSCCGVLRTLSAYVGGFDLDLYRRVNGEIPDTPRQLDPRYAGYAERPLWGPHAPGAIDLGNHGYHCPNYQEQLQLAFEAAARDRQKKTEGVS